VRFLIDEMFPPGTNAHLVQRDHDAVHGRDRGLDARPDSEVATVAAREERVLVTENVKDFAGVRGIALVCMLMSRLPPHGMDVHLASVLDGWAAVNSEPYLGLHWPAVGR
jgi:hypothetical protein